MSWLEIVNRNLFMLINARADAAAGINLFAVICAQWVIVIIPLALTYLYFRGPRSQRIAAVSSVLVTLGALACGALIGWVYPHPRPFAIGLGHQLIAHVADPSFPSDHGLLFFAIGLSLFRFSARGWGLLITLLGVLVGWSRVYVGVHYPLDILGALLLSLLVLHVLHRYLAVTRYGEWLLDRADAILAKVVPIKMLPVTALPVAAQRQGQR